MLFSVESVLLYFPKFNKQNTCKFTQSSDHVFLKSLEMVQLCVLDTSVGLVLLHCQTWCQRRFLSQNSPLKIFVLFPLLKRFLEEFLRLLKSCLKWIFQIFRPLYTLLMSINIKFILIQKSICIWELRYISFIFNYGVKKLFLDVDFL